LGERGGGRLASDELSELPRVSLLYVRETTFKGWLEEKYRAPEAASRLKTVFRMSPSSA